MKEKAQDVQELQQKISQLQTIVELGRAMTSSINGEDLYRTMLKKISDLLKPSSWALLLYDEHRKQLYYEMIVNDPQVDREKFLALGEGIPGWVAKHQTSVFFQPHQPCILPPELTQYERRSFLCVPLSSKGLFQGLIHLHRDSKDKPFTASDLTQLEELAQFMAIGIENYRHIQRIEELTIKDDLTQLYNSRYLHHVLDREIDLSKRYKREFSVIFFDLDHFKSVNDLHGHVYGSELLKEVGKIVDDNIRSTDYAARYGGDEFVIILPETPKSEGIELAERLRSVIEKNQFLSEKNKDIRFTASFGVATFPNDAHEKDQIIQMADDAMYSAKKISRNRVISISSKS
ncbi:MAG: sensor domain-containing diguanylate cyclase [Bdellovibrionales bacterium]|nr:sensor domain-containing diguanylate cyclase [Bdellovibrionales bacterium]